MMKTMLRSKIVGFVMTLLLTASTIVAPQTTHAKERTGVVDGENLNIIEASDVVIEEAVSVEVTEFDVSKKVFNLKS